MNLIIGKIIKNKWTGRLYRIIDTVADMETLACRIERACKIEDIMNTDRTWESESFLQKNFTEVHK